jgi:tetratricopeptide (TPR) repeat protein
MSEPSRFREQYSGNLAALALRPEHGEEFQRLVKTLRHGPQTHLFLLAFTDVPYRDQVRARLDALLAEDGQRVATIRLDDTAYPDFARLELDLCRLAEAGHQAVHVLGGEGWFQPERHPERWETFNIRREAIFHGARTHLLFWLAAAAIAPCAERAPDLWSWRAGVYDFATPMEPAPPPLLAPPERGPIDPRTLAERRRRIAEIKTWLAATPPPEEEIRLPLLDELAKLLESLGEYDEALRIRREEELPVYERLGDARSRAVTLGRIAGILVKRGELDEALRLLREEVLPTFERLGDARSRAVTLGQIADILTNRGELDEALRLLREEELPVYERLGDARSRANTLSNIAVILQLRGEYDEVLRLLREEVLPTFERLGDARSRAVALGRIADILTNRGELDEALRIRREEELPVYERLGDARSRAVTLGQIADILTNRGEYDEALRLLREEVLPTFERLGDVREHAVAAVKLSHLLWRNGARAEAASMLFRAHADAVRLGLPEAAQIRRDMDELGLPADSPAATTATPFPTTPAAPGTPGHRKHKSTKGNRKPPWRR